MERVVGGRYALIESVGGGSYGSVWAAWDRRSDEWVAVKLSKDSGEEALLRFAREQRLVLDHPHLCSPIDSGFDGGVPFVVMPLVRGGTLAEYLADEGTLDPDAAEQLIAQIHDALGYLHELGIVHRDVQPSNILLDSTPPEGGHFCAYLADFGYALRVDASRLTSTELIAGTAGYRSPEVCMGHDASPASDHYSLAVVAYEAVTGKRIAHRSEPKPLAGAQLFSDPSDLDLFELSPSVRGYIKANLAEDPAERLGLPPMRRAIRGFAVDARIELDAQPPGPVRRPRVRTVFAAGLVTVGIAVAVLLARVDRPNPASGSSDARALANPAALSGSASPGHHRPSPTGRRPATPTTTAPTPTSAPIPTSAPVPTSAPTPLPPTTAMAPLPTVSSNQVSLQPTTLAPTTTPGPPPVPNDLAKARAKLIELDRFPVQSRGFENAYGLGIVSTVAAHPTSQEDSGFRYYFFANGEIVGIDSACSGRGAAYNLVKGDPMTILISYPVTVYGQEAYGRADVRFHWTGSKLQVLDPMPTCQARGAYAP